MLWWKTVCSRKHHFINDKNNYLWNRNNDVLKTSLLTYNCWFFFVLSDVHWKISKDPTQLHFLGELWANCHFNVNLISNTYKWYIQMCSTQILRQQLNLKKRHGRNIFGTWILHVNNWNTSPKYKQVRLNVKLFSSKLAITQSLQFKLQIFSSHFSHVNTGFKSNRLNTLLCTFPCFGELFVQYSQQRETFPAFGL